VRGVGAVEDLNAPLVEHRRGCRSARRPLSWCPARLHTIINKSASVRYPQALRRALRTRVQLRVGTREDGSEGARVDECAQAAVPPQETLRVIEFCFFQLYLRSGPEPAVPAVPTGWRQVPGSFCGGRTT
jgi:hypothetical protein